MENPDRGGTNGLCIDGLGEQPGAAMSLDIKIVQHDDYLEAVVSGTYDMQAAAARFPLVMAACRLAGVPRALIDFRELAGMPAATEQVLYVFDIQDQYQSHLDAGELPLRIAYLGTPRQVSVNDPSLQIVRQHNLPFDLFADFDAAMAWLGVALPGGGSILPTGGG